MIEMRAISSEPVRSLILNSNMECTDNTGAKAVYMITAYGQKTRKKQSPSAGIADMVNVVVSKGKPEMRKKKFKAIIVRTRKGMKRANGIIIKFDDNACVLVDDEGVPKATEIKGVVPKEVGERWPKVLGQAAFVI